METSFSILKGVKDVESAQRAKDELLKANERITASIKQLRHMEKPPKEMLDKFKEIYDRRGRQLIVLFGRQKDRINQSPELHEILGETLDKI